MSAAGTLNLERVVLIVIQNLCGNGWGAEDKFVIIVVKLVYGRYMRSTSDIALGLMASCNIASFS